jgi:hypothetical protein
MRSLEGRIYVYQRAWRRRRLDIINLFTEQTE